MSRMQLMVCPHDTARNPERWFLFAQYLSHHLGDPVHFEQSLDFAEFQAGMAGADLVYANPQHALKLTDEHGYIPLARAGNLYDEAVLVTCAECDAQAADFHHAPIATVPSMLVTQVALQSLHRQGIDPEGLRPAANWMGVVQALYKGEARFGILYKDFYEGMSRLSRQQVRVVGETSERSVYHCFMLAPRHADRAEAVRRVLLEMAGESKGAEIMASLLMERMVAVAPGDLEAIRALRG
ncbi:MAG: phosphate/phosphite/phosphonate ABC transporter substrate-binding protein [Halothiobacillaceae bacterium]|nr:MAG: phosphate/phosphite/phosphonate ABC transporter substrate-binding protein [Halothiobacillaceae bacterium]